MRKLAIYFAVVVFCAVSGVAQGNTASSGSDTKTATKKSKQPASSKAKSGKHQVTGCLSGPNNEGAYTITNGRYTNGLEVGGDDDLKSHIGHKVTLTGTWASAADIGEKETGAADKEKNERHLKVTSIKHVADSCSAPTARKGGKKSKAAPTT